MGDLHLVISVDWQAEDSRLSGDIKGEKTRRKGQNDSAAGSGSPGFPIVSSAAPRLKAAVIGFN
jgi:hypothetical protein